MGQDPHPADDVASVSIGYTYHECPDCEYDMITKETAGQCWCPLCAGDSSHDVRMKSRPATEGDKVEGFDARTADPKRYSPT